jgi:hypothetical protein
LLKDDGTETTVTAKMSNPTESGNAAAKTDRDADKPDDASEELLQTLYKTIRDDLVDE